MLVQFSRPDFAKGEKSKSVNIPTDNLDFFAGPNRILLAKAARKSAGHLVWQVIIIPNIYNCITTAEEDTKYQLM